MKFKLELRKERLYKSLDGVEITKDDVGKKVICIKPTTIESMDCKEDGSYDRADIKVGTILQIDMSWDDEDNHLFGINGEYEGNRINDLAYKTQWAFYD